MNRKKKTIGILLICTLFCTSACALNGGDGATKLQKASQPETTYATAIKVDGHDMVLGMSEEDSFFDNKGLDRYTVSSGIVCDHVKMQNCWSLYTMEKRCVEVMGEQAMIHAFFDENLQELFVAWNDKADEADLLNGLIEQYGENYTMDTIFYAGYQSAYRWDLPDGSSIFFLPMDKTLSKEYRYQHSRWDEQDAFYVGPCLFMAPTVDVTEIQIPGEE